MASSNSSYFSRPTIKSLVVANTQQINNLMANSDGVNPDQLFHKPVHTLFNHLLQSEQLYIATGFIESKMILIYHLLQLFIIMVRQPGARPKSTWLDMVICYLAWLKLGQDYLVLACALKRYHCNTIKR
jgi:hypothetical protein